MSEKWQNIDAGPRQIKDLQTALNELLREGQSHDELSGVIGGHDRGCTLWSPFDAVRPEVTALDEAIRDKYSHEITRATVRAIIADYGAALAPAQESRPVIDNRITPEEDAERQAASAARDAEYQAQRNAEQDLMAAVLAKAPPGSHGLIIAELHEDTSDTQTDYFASRTLRTVAIGYRFSKREDFRALHAAAGTFAETAGEEFSEHRDNHSMGAGDYLSDHGSANWGSGWVIRSRDFPCNWVSLTEDAIPEPGSPDAGEPATFTSPGGVTVSPSSLGRDGVVEVRFDARPADDILAGLKAHGFRWARRNRCWYGSDINFAEALAAV